MQFYTTSQIIILRGLGQIMLQRNQATGLLFLLGLVWGDLYFALAALLAVSSASLGAYLLKFDTERLISGIYGFSSGLVGVAFMVFFKPTWEVWLILPLAAFMTMLLQEALARWNLSLFTLPFVVVTWVAFFVISSWFPSLMAEASQPSSLFAKDLEFYFFGFKGVGQVIFQDDLLAGIAFTLGIFLSNPLAGFIALSSSFLGGLAALGLSLPLEEVGLGLFGFNLVLTGIVFARLGWLNFAWLIFALFLTFVIYLAMRELELLALTFPFVAASFLTLALQKWLARSY